MRFSAVVTLDRQRNEPGRTLRNELADAIETMLLTSGVRLGRRQYRVTIETVKTDPRRCGECDACQEWLLDPPRAPACTSQP